ncbi:MAG: response regulator transcription factor [Bacteroidota bacterium]
MSDAARPPVRVLLVDDHPTIRSAVKRSLDVEDDLEVVGEAATAKDALRLANELKPDVMVLDVDLPDGSGVEVAGALRESSTRILAFTAYTGHAFVRGLLDAGAAGYVTKDKDESELVTAIRAIARGEGRWYVVPNTSADPLNALTEREQDVLTLLARGLSNSAIAETLFVSESTVRNTLTTVYHKIQVSTSREAIAWAWDNGFRPPS